MNLYRTFAITVTIMLSLTAFSQEKIEILIPWEDAVNSTSAWGNNVREIDNGDFIVLGQLRAFYPGHGVPIEGYPPRGTMVARISQNGQVLWKKKYNTTCTYGPQINCNFVATQSFEIISDDKIIIPYSYFTGYFTCDTVPPEIAYPQKKHGILITEIESGSLLRKELISDNVLCGPHYDKIRGIKKMEDGFLLLYYEYSSDMDIEVERIDNDFQRLSIDTIETYSALRQLSKTEDKIILATDTSVAFTDYDGTNMEFCVFEKTDFLNSPSLLMTENEQYIVLGMYQYNFYEEQIYSALKVIDKNCYELSSALFENTLIKDLIISDENDIIALFDETKNDSDDSTNYPVRVTLFDLQLNELASREYGEPYISPSYINLSKDQESFMITGAKFTSFLDTLNEASDQMYFLKAPISDLIPTSVTDLSQKGGLSVYPNPAMETITVNLSDKEKVSDKIKFELIDNMGRLIQSGEKNHLPFDIEVQYINPGTYFLKILLGDKQYSTKVNLQ